MSDDVTSPEHYNSGDVECIDAIWATGRGLDFCLGNAIKYLWRAGKKGDLETDVAKAFFYVGYALSKLSPDAYRDPRTWDDDEAGDDDADSDDDWTPESEIEGMIVERV